MAYNQYASYFNTAPHAMHMNTIQPDHMHNFDLSYLSICNTEGVQIFCLQNAPFGLSTLDYNFRFTAHPLCFISKGTKSVSIGSFWGQGIPHTQCHHRPLGDCNV